MGIKVKKRARADQPAYLVSFPDRLSLWQRVDTLDKLATRNSQALSHVMSELLMMMEERDAEMFRMAEQLLDNALAHTKRYREPEDAFIGRWALRIDDVPFYVSNYKGPAYIQIYPNLQGTYQFSDLRASLQGRVDNNRVFRFKWAGMRKGREVSGSGFVQLDNMHHHHDWIRGVVDVDDQEDAAAWPFRGQRSYNNHTPQVSDL
eukprot:TRINITY_DN2027_c0_g1_i3.p1 TRINITY_DN2027_c0_g1~~TRINITY_DN2027_c0_g1_i3.p1  ORF type:complete len:205 (+),score=25.81 TRINITY_DN2027_c0_g1_i3:289-903(+)